MQVPPGVNVLHAGSLATLVQGGLAPAVQRDLDFPVTNVAGNSVALANGIKDGSKTGDIFMSADAGVNAQLMGADNGDWVRWFAVFARNSMVIGYSPQSRFADDFAVAQAAVPSPGTRCSRSPT